MPPMAPSKPPLWIRGIKQEMMMMMMMMMMMAVAILRWNGPQNKRGCILRAGLLLLVTSKVISTRLCKVTPKEGLVPLRRRAQHVELSIP
jgi:hypothetical protein